MRRFQEKRGSGVMPSAYVTYDGHCHEGGKGSDIPLPVVVRGRQRSPDTSCRMARRKSGTVQKSVDRLENWLGSKRKFTVPIDAPVGGVLQLPLLSESQTGKRTAPLPPPMTTIGTTKALISCGGGGIGHNSVDYSSTSVPGAECDGRGSSGASAASATTSTSTSSAASISSSLNHSSSSSRSDGSSSSSSREVRPTLPIPGSYIHRPANTFFVQPQQHFCGTTNSSVPSNAAHLPHRPSAFSISSSSDGSSGSSSTDSRDSTPMNSSHRNGNINEPSTSRGGGGGVMVHKNPLLNVAASGGGGGGGHSHTPGSSSSVSLSSSSQSGHNMPSHDQPAAISRKKIISKSQETGLNGGEGRTVRNRNSVEEDDDVWFDKESLFRHHLKEVFEKWPYIDDEIWSKVICMEKNRRVAKAYARVPKITINGSDEGFDGQRIGLSGFDNAKRNPDTERIKQHIGQGIQLKMDNAGNILVKCASSAPVYVYTTSGNFQEDSCLSDELIRSEGELDSDLPMKVFDVLRFKKNIDKEMKRSYPDRRKLELQCFTSIVFGEQIGDGGHLDFSCWIMLINIVALDMLKIDFPSREAPGNRGIAPIRPNRPSANDTGSKRYLSTPRDEHYPRLLQQHSMADLSLLESNEYGNDDFDDRASISTYNYVPAYRGHGNMTPMLTSDYADLHLISPQQRRDQLYRSLEQQQYGQDPYYGVDLQYGGMGPGSSTASMVGNAGGTSAYGRSATPLGLSHHALTEPNFKLRDSISGISGRNFTAPSLQRFGVHSRHSRSYDSGLEADVSSISDDAADYGRWTSYQRAQQALPHRQVQHLQQLHRLPPQEWE